MKIFSILIFKIKRRLLTYINKAKTPNFLLKLFFDIDSHKGTKKIKRKNNLFITEQTFNNRSFLWSFPSSLKERGRKCYLNGLELRAKEIYEDYLLKNFEFEDNDLVIDCGANFGDLYLYLDSLNYRINYFGIEPGKREFEALTYNTQKNKSLIKSELFNIDFWEGQFQDEFILFTFWRRLFFN